MVTIYCVLSQLYCFSIWWCAIFDDYLAGILYFLCHIKYIKLSSICFEMSIVLTSNAIVNLIFGMLVMFQSFLINVYWCMIKHLRLLFIKRIQCMHNTACTIMSLCTWNINLVTLLYKTFIYSTIHNDKFLIVVKMHFPINVSVNDGNALVGVCVCNLWIQAHSKLRWPSTY